MIDPLRMEEKARAAVFESGQDVLPAIWINGERHSPAGLHLSASDRGVTLGDGVFETMRAHGGGVFRLDRHLGRLVRGLAALAIPARPELRDWVLDALRKSGAADVPFASR